VAERSVAALITIRQATATDVDTIVRHRRQMFVDMGLGDAASLDAMSAAARLTIRSGLQDGSYRGWLAESGGDVVAGGGLVIFNYQPSPSEPEARRASILNMYTEPQYRRRGLARQLVHAILAWCRQQGFHAVSLHASEDGRPLYESLGFRPTSEMRLVLE
jgi:GNAT superfamily N-acetyltransferase